MHLFDKWWFTETFQYIISADEDMNQMYYLIISLLSYYVLGIDKKSLHQKSPTKAFSVHHPESPIPSSLVVYPSKWEREHCMSKKLNQLVFFFFLFVEQRIESKNEKHPRQDKKIISNVVKEISINWKYYYTCKFLDAWSNIVSTTSRVTSYNPLYYISESFL